MPEKNLLCWKTSIWGNGVAWTQIFFSGIKELILVMQLISEYHRYNYCTHPVPQNISQSSQDPDTLVEFPNQYDGACHFGILSVLLEFALLTIGFIAVLILGVVLHRGCKQRNIRYLKAWLIFATISIVWHVFSIALMLAVGYEIAILMLVEMIGFVILYMFGIGVVSSFVSTLLADQNAGGEELPKYETMSDEQL